MRRAVPFLFALLSFISPAAAVDPVLRVAYNGKALALTPEEFGQLPHVKLKAVEPHEKKERLYAGVAMRELLRRVDAPFGEQLRGPALTLGVLVRCQDGYAVLYALAEFDENFSDRILLLADREDGQSPPASAAPLRLVAPGDKRGARWARRVSAIEIVSLAPKP